MLGNSVIQPSQCVAQHCVVYSQKFSDRRQRREISALFRVRVEVSQGSLRGVRVSRTLGLLDDDRAFHDRVKCTRIGKISCLLKGMSPSAVRSD
jgi:hypothetical protein